MFEILNKSEPASDSSLTSDPLWPLISMSQDQYRKIYLKTIENSGIEFAGKPLETLAVSALKLHKGIIIPTGVPPEDAVKSNETWTYLLFLTILAESFGFFDHAEDAKKWITSVVPNEYVNWIDNRTAEVLIQSCCGEDAGPKYPILKIISLAKNGRIFTNNEVVIPDFIAWIERSVNDQTIRINTKSSRAHLVAEGFLIKHSLIELYISSNNHSFSVQLLKELLFEFELCLGEKEYGVVNEDTKNTVDGILLDSSIFTFEKNEINGDLARLESV